VIDGVLPVELKAIEGILPVHEAQLLTYMKLLKAPEGLLINFNVTNIYKQGQRTLVNELYRILQDS
jgi:GxxExxY protein